MTEEEQFESFIKGISFLMRPAILASLAAFSALVAGGSFWRALVAGMIMFVLMLSGLGRRTLEKICLGSSLIALIWWLHIPAVVVTANSVYSVLIAR